jgi:sporulation protein YlmC with PRC-barrel domain
VRDSSRTQAPPVPRRGYFSRACSSAVTNGALSTSKTDDHQCAADLLDATGIRKPGKRKTHEEGRITNSAHELSLCGGTRFGDAGLVVALARTLDVHSAAEGYRASKLIGSSVVNDQNEKIGTVEDIIIGKDKVLFAVLQVGGFLHIGGRMVAVPFQSLVLEDNGTKIKLPGATQEALKKLPEFKYAS